MTSKHVILAGCSEIREVKLSAVANCIFNSTSTSYRPVYAYINIIIQEYYNLSNDIQDYYDLFCIMIYSVIKPIGSDFSVGKKNPFIKNYEDLAF